MFILLVVISLILLASGLWMFYSKMILEKYGVKAVGRVIRNEKFIEHTVDSFDQIIEITVYRPIIEFETEDGLKLQAVCDEGSNPPKTGDVSSPIMALASILTLSGVYLFKNRKHK